MDEETVIQAAANGHMNVFEWCRANGYPVPDYYAHLESASIYNVCEVSFYFCLEVSTQDMYSS